MEKKIENLKKMHDTEDDIREIDNVLKNYHNFHYCTSQLLLVLNDFSCKMINIF